MKRAIACIHTVMHVSTSIQLHLKRLWTDHCLSMLPLGTTVHVIFMLSCSWQVNMKKNMLNSSLSVTVEIVAKRIENNRETFHYQSCTCEWLWISKPFHIFIHRELKALVLTGKCISPLQPDTWRSDIIIYGQSCWQRNANIDLEAQSLTKLLTPLSHEAQWCLYGNFMRPLKQHIRRWSVIFLTALFHNHPHRWWTSNSGKHTNRI